MASSISDDDICSICDLQDKSVSAVVWCSVCDENYCPACKTHHGLATATRNHRTTDITSAKCVRSILKEVKLKCTDHKNMFQYFCTKHEIPLCSCCLTDHKSCGEISSVGNLNGASDSNVIFDYEKTLESLLEAIKIVIENKTTNVTDMRSQVDSIRTTIKDTRMKINQSLDKAEEKLLKELENAYKEQKTRLEGITTVLNKLKNKVNKLKIDMDAVKQGASETQIFLTAKRFSTDAQEVKENITNIINSKENDQIEITFITETNFENEAGFGALGKVKILTKPSKTLLQTHAKLMLPLNLMYRIQLNKTLDVDFTDITEGTQTWGCCYMEDNTVLVTNYEKSRVIMLTEKGNFIRDIRVRDKPNKIVSVKRNVYITSHTAMTLVCLDVDTEQIVKELKFDVSCDALTLADNKIIVQLNDLEYRVLDLNLDLMNKIPIQEHNTPHLAYFDEKIYFFSRGKSVLFCYDTSGKMIWKLKDKDLPLSSGLAVDNYGHVFLACISAEQIIKISPDGKKWETALKLENMKNVTVISLNAKRNKLLVISEIESRIQEFDVSY